VIASLEFRNYCERFAGAPGSLAEFKLPGAALDLPPGAASGFLFWRFGGGFCSGA